MRKASDQSSEPPTWLSAQVDDPLPWTPMPGGRTNQVWSTATQVVKLFRPENASSLFPNDPFAEMRALRHLVGPGLAVRPTRLICAEQGTAITCEKAEARIPPAAQRAELLAQLHHLPPVGMVRQIHSDSAATEAELSHWWPGIGDLRELLPQMPKPTTADGPVAILHGDPVPANFVTLHGTPRLVDWQSAGIGDPAHDLALALSPAMNSLYQGDSAEFRDHYGGSESYDQLAPWLHYRIAAYCLWRAAQGDQDYLAAAKLEIAYLCDLP